MFVDENLLISVRVKSLRSIPDSLLPNPFDILADPSGSGAPPSVVDWTQLMAFVQQLGDDFEKTKDELTRTKHLLATKDRAAKPNKPSLFSGKYGTIEAWF